MCSPYFVSVIQKHFSDSFHFEHKINKAFNSCPKPKISSVIVFTMFAFELFGLGYFVSVIQKHFSYSFHFKHKINKTFHSCPKPKISSGSCSPCSRLNSLAWGTLSLLFKSISLIHSISSTRLTRLFVVVLSQRFQA